MSDALAPPAGPDDEARHAPSAGTFWNESWYFDFSRADGTGGFVRLGLYPNQNVAWYWAYLVFPDTPGPVVVRDHEVSLPRGRALEVRAEGLWAECTCETPMEHWTLGLEAFGVRLDDPADAYRGEIGERLPVGLDLEWEVAAPPYTYEYRADDPHRHYQHAGIVHGEILLGRERIEFDGHGERDHSWGPRDWWTHDWHWSAFQLPDERAFHVVYTDDAVDGYVWSGGQGLDRVDDLRFDVHEDSQRLPVAARYVIETDASGDGDGSGGAGGAGAEFEVDVEVLGVAPIPLVAPDGRTARFPRALCRYTLRDTGDWGTGWAGWLQVGAPLS